MSFLENKQIYLSGPIEHGDAFNWRAEPKNTLINEFKLRVFDPFDDPKQQWAPLIRKAQEENDYDTIARIAKGFVRKDLCLVDRADLLIAWLPYRVATTGTHHEIINSNNAKKPTLLVSDKKSHIPAWYYGFISHEFMFGSWDDLYVYLREVNEGKHMDNDKWAFIYGLV